MKGQNLVILDEKSIPQYLSNEKVPQVKYRLAFLNALLKTNYAFEKVCDIFHVAAPTAYVWIRKWNHYGYEGIVHPFHSSDNPPGRPPTFDTHDIETLKALLESKDNWQAKEVRELISDVWGIDFSESQVSRILKDKIGMKFSKPYPHDFRRPNDAEQQLDEAITCAYNKLINKGIKPEEIAIGFLDESSPQLTANTARTWHFGRHANIEKNTTKYKANTIGFYAIHGLSVNGFLPDSTTDSIQRFIEKVRSENGKYKSVIVILDNFSSHRSKTLQRRSEEIAIELVYLPPYSPDLNPIEFIWKTLKRYISLEHIGSPSHLRRIISDVWEECSNKCSFSKHWIDRFVPNFVTYSEFCA